MKKIHLIGIIVIAAAIGLLTTAANDMATYSSFSDAYKTGDKVKIVGQLCKDKEMVYNPSKDPNYFSFFVRDNKGEEHKVILLSGKPQDFELSEQIVVTGQVQGKDFVASDLLMKCPSKYKNEEVYVKSEKKNT